VKRLIFWGTLKIDYRNLTAGARAISVTEDPSSPEFKTWEAVALSEILVCDFAVTPFENNGYMLKGTVKGTQLLECSRTLEMFPHPFCIPMQLVVQRNHSGEGWVLDENDGEIPIIRLSTQTNEFDISECVRQEILLNEPMSPVKDAESDFSWNDPLLQNPKEDSTAQIDPRWQKLMELKNNNKPN
jgi:uncharacterized metal-binding protein YceD (DUF177 family)